MELAEIASTATTLVISNLIIGIIISVISLVLHIIFIIRVWVIVRYHYYKIKDEERAKKIKREYHELIQEEKETEIIENFEELKKEETTKEEKTLKEKVNSFLFREW